MTKNRKSQKLLGGIKMNIHDATEVSWKNGYEKGVKEFAEEITKIFVRYSHLHNYAEKARTETIESAEGNKIEMQSVWDVLSLKKI